MLNGWRAAARLKRCDVSAFVTGRSGPSAREIGVSSTAKQGHRSSGMLRNLLALMAMGALLLGCASSHSGGVQVVDRNNAASQRQPVTSGQYLSLIHI